MSLIPLANDIKTKTKQLVDMMDDEDNHKEERIEVNPLDPKNSEALDENPDLGKSLEKTPAIFKRKALEFLEEMCCDEEKASTYFNDTSAEIKDKTMKVVDLVLSKAEDDEINLIAGRNPSLREEVRAMTTIERLRLMLDDSKRKFGYNLGDPNSEDDGDRKNDVGSESVEDLNTVAEEEMGTKAVRQNAKREKMIYGQSETDFAAAPTESPNFSLEDVMSEEKFGYKSEDVMPEENLGNRGEIEEEAEYCAPDEITQLIPKGLNTPF